MHAFKYHKLLSALLILIWGWVATPIMADKLPPAIMEDSTHLDGEEDGLIQEGDDIFEPPAMEEREPRLEEPYTKGLKRVGAICEDGFRSDAIGQGACAQHGGVKYWLLDDGSTQAPAKKKKAESIDTEAYLYYSVEILGILIAGASLIYMIRRNKKS